VKPVKPKLEIGGVSVEPGGRVTIDLPVANLSTHTQMNMPVQVLRGRRPGPTLFVCGALHGDEIVGVEIIRRLLNQKTLARLRGTLIAVPIVNVFGFIGGSRYLPDRRDLNRSFPGSARGSLAARLGHLFMTEVVAKCTHGIDIHSGAIHRTNFPQIRANLDDPETLRLAKAFEAPVIINAGEREGTLRQAGTAKDVTMLLYEAGEALRFDEISIRAGLRGVVNVMRALDMLPAGRRRSRHVEPVLARSCGWVRAQESGILRATTRLGARVEKGVSLGLISDPFGEAECVVKAHDSGVIIGRTNLPLVQEGDALFHIASPAGEKATFDSLQAFESDFDQHQQSMLHD